MVGDRPQSAADDRVFHTILDGCTIKIDRSLHKGTVLLNNIIWLNVFSICCHFHDHFVIFVNRSIIKIMFIKSLS